MGHKDDAQETVALLKGQCEQFDVKFKGAFVPISRGRVKVF